MPIIRRQAAVGQLESLARAAGQGDRVEREANLRAQERQLDNQDQQLELQRRNAERADLQLKRQLEIDQFNQAMQIQTDAFNRQQAERRQALDALELQRQAEQDAINRQNQDRAFIEAKRVADVGFELKRLTEERLTKQQRIDAQNNARKMLLDAGVEVGNTIADLIKRGGEFLGNARRAAATNDLINSLPEDLRKRIGPVLRGEVQGLIPAGTGTELIKQLALPKETGLVERLGSKNDKVAEMESQIKTASEEYNLAKQEESVLTTMIRDADDKVKSVKDAVTRELGISGSNSDEKVESDPLVKDAILKRNELVQQRNAAVIAMRAALSTQKIVVDRLKVYREAIIEERNAGSNVGQSDEERTRNTLNELGVRSPNARAR